MNCEIVTIGSELLLGQIIDTPEGSIPIPNEVGTAPGFIAEIRIKVNYCPSGGAKRAEIHPEQGDSYYLNLVHFRGIQRPPVSCPSAGKAGGHVGKVIQAKPLLSDSTQYIVRSARELGAGQTRHSRLRISLLPWAG